jgi:hypothetical protein
MEQHGGDPGEPGNRLGLRLSRPPYLLGDRRGQLRLRHDRSANPGIRVTGELAFPALNQELDKVGRTTGWMYGRVTRTCTDVPINGRIVLCQDWIGNMHSGPGDAGAPVFRWNAGTATLAGITSGGITSSGSTQVVFGAMSNIRSDHGSMLTH